MQDLSLHVMDILENSIAAGAKKVTVKISCCRERAELVLEIVDDGKGMDDETRERALDPFFTTKTGKKTGLGLSLLKQAAEQCEGGMALTSAFGRGTVVRAVFRQNHPDMKPLGDMEGTIFLLKMAHPEIVFDFIQEMED